jgi:ABC-type antimicrobial peptide transport system permease subunit
MFLPGENPEGQRIQLTSAGPSAFSATPSAPGAAPWLTVVGVALDVPQRGAAGDEQDPIVYVPYRGEPEPVRSASLIVRGQPGVDVVSSIRETIRLLEPDLAVYMVFTMEQVFGMVRLAQRMFADIFVMLACIALALSSVGLYAVTAYGVAQRTQEIGVRMALGARRGQLVWLFTRETAVHLAIGTTIGVAGALAGGQLLQSILVHTSPRDPVVLLGVAVLLATVAMIAAIVPARRAAHVDPMVALRHS